MGIPMRKIISITAASFLLFSMSASADVAQVWRCTLNDAVESDDADAPTPGEALEAISKDWLAKAREIDENASITAFFPINADAEEGEYVFIFFLPDFASWGAFMDAYPDSAVAEVDSGWDDVGPCETSELWVTNDFE